MTADKKTTKLSIALAQINPVLGDITANIETLRRIRKQAASLGADLVVTSECVVTGYPLEDLILKRLFQNTVMSALQLLAKETADGGPAMLVGTPWIEEGRIYNAALLLEDGKIAGKTFKYDLPNYGVFDEKRIFTAGELPDPILYKGVKLGVMICEDMWTKSVTKHLAEKGAEMMIVLNGSPFEMEKDSIRLELAAKRVQESGRALIYMNQIGGQDELVFDGGSFVLSHHGNLMARLSSWEEEVMLTYWHSQKDQYGDHWICHEAPKAAPLPFKEGLYHALMMGLRDYVTKNKFPGVILGLSGGIDSALSIAIAVDALGAEKVRAVMMPSPYTSKESLEDAKALADNLGVRLDNIPIMPAMKAFEEMLDPFFARHKADKTEENIQSRIRGLILMALSNKFGHMVLSTGNKSEMSVGYATLYGDMCGGYNVLKDLYKERVYQLSNWRNHHRPEEAKGPEGVVIPQRIITRPPSAELKPNQTDQDSLPPYEILDEVLRHLIEEERPVTEVIAEGYDEDVVYRIWHMIDAAEYKRRQAPPGVKVGTKAFGRDRRYPITNRFRLNPSKD